MVAEVGGNEAEVFESEIMVAVESIAQEQLNFLQQIAVTPTPSKLQETVETISLSRFVCQYVFSYLSQREKGEGIPDSCIECPDSLDCMLSQYYKKDKNVKEIKKWYNF
jgi:hypothetical protein